MSQTHEMRGNPLGKVKLKQKYSLILSEGCVSTTFGKKTLGKCKILMM